LCEMRLSAYFVVFASIFVIGLHTVACAVEESSQQQPFVTKSTTKKIKICPVKSCGTNQTSEVASWECLGRHLFRPSDDPMSERFVEHDCGGVGWGNSFRAMYNAFAIAAVLDRRILIRYWPGNNPFWKLWNPPYDLNAWDYGLDALREKHLNIPEHMRGKAWAFGHHLYNDMWDFESYGRRPGKFQKWVKGLKSSKDLQNQYNKTVLNTAICGAEPEFFTDGNCITKAFPLFEKCLKDEPQMHLPDPIMLVPFFHSIFSKPSSLLVEKLDVVRDRLGLHKPDGWEPWPGAWGLQTPGYYIYALHFRRVPLGFEPLSVELSGDQSLQWKLSILKAFWATAVSNAKQAKRIAKCRNETLLIYFATDDIHHLRPEAEKYLGKFGRVIFGLMDKEVGHISAQWSQNAIDAVQDRAVAMYHEGKIGVGSSSVLNKNALPSVQERAAVAEIDSEGGAVVTTDDEEEEPNLGDLLVDVDTDEESVNNHAIWSLVEWFVT
jgi:hypothetical protein